MSLTHLPEALSEKRSLGESRFQIWFQVAIASPWIRLASDSRTTVPHSTWQVVKGFFNLHAHLTNDRVLARHSNGLPYFYMKSVCLNRVHPLVALFKFQCGTELESELIDRRMLRFTDDA